MLIKPSLEASDILISRRLAINIKIYIESGGRHFLKVEHLPYPAYVIEPFAMSTIIIQQRRIIVVNPDRWPLKTYEMPIDSLLSAKPINHPLNKLLFITALSIFPNINCIVKEHCEIERAFRKGAEFLHTAHSIECAKQDIYSWPCRQINC